MLATNRDVILISMNSTPLKLRVIFMSNHVEPTIGRIVWYRGKDNAVRAAIVTYVWSQFLINLQVFGKDQNDTEAGIHTSVTHGDIEHEPSCCPSWSWMPYQKGQAAKTEQLEQKLVSGSVGCDKSNGTQDAIIEQEIIDKGLVYPRVEKSRIDELMARVRYDCHVVENTTTTVVTAILPITDHINFTVATEIMACVDPRNFNKELGEKYGIEKAADAARNKLWELEGYYLARQIQAEMELKSLIGRGGIQNC